MKYVKFPYIDNCVDWIYFHAIVYLVNCGYLLNQLPQFTILLRKSRHGKAVFANKDFGKGDFIIEFKGKIYRRKDRPRGLHSKINRYLQIDKDMYIGPSKKIDDYINHSCNPNAGIRISDKVQLFAIRRIKEGEEIKFDYSTTMDEGYWEMICRCGYKRCRKKIRDFKYLPKSFQQKYIKLGIVPKYILENLAKRG